jgi:undecaprenyl-phosphate galactose phosphotransferase/putative colanic acid biosynthesis UDP-glucose lipid carrier transferase
MSFNSDVTLDERRFSPAAELRADDVGSQLVTAPAGRSVKPNPRQQKTSQAGLRPRARGLKRVVDAMAAGVALLVLLPLFLSIALLIRLDSRGPVLFRQTRIGLNGRKFVILKFRTMNVLEDGPDIRQATKNDDRVTRIGRWLRATSIDELPQLLNVVAGEMSLVGPRPHAVAHDIQYRSLIAGYSQRHDVKPGITGWAQVCGFRGETPSVELMEKRVEHDLWYVEHWSFWLDFKIVLQTAAALMRPQNAH